MCIRDSPESYKSAKELLALLDYSDKEIKKGKFTDLANRVSAKETKSLADTLKIGLPTVDDIVKELSKPGRDPRDEVPAPMLRSDILDIKDVYKRQAPGKAAADPVAL